MRRLYNMIRTFVLYLSALLLVAGYPIMAMAEAPVVTAAPTTSATDSSTAAPPKPTYSYNPATGMWDSNTWRFNATTGLYEAVPPAPVVVDPPAVSPASADQSKPASQAPADQTPTSSAASATTTTQSNVDVNNQIGSLATTGDASVLANTAAGSAATGDATATAILLNNVNSVIAAGNNQKAANFTYNVMGDVNGDIMLYPLLLKTMLEGAATGTPLTNSTVSVADAKTLTNNVNLQAASGNATVGSNTSAGNATTGSANTVANVMNILNSMISANQSFIGTINIYGSLHGDILIAPDFIPQMIASNKTLQSVPTGTSTVQSNDMQSIVNNVALAAKTGSAAVLDNTAAGNATTGSANTGVVIFNLSGHAIVAKNSLLVFVNVLGKWVGVIVDAPSGATSAMIGNGVVSDVVSQPDLTVTAKTTNSITNNITLTAQSGDALVKGNTLAGNATSGHATASANIANISGSQIGLCDWFGVLFINVFDSWYGSFGVNTSYGDAPPVGINMPGTTLRPGAITFVPRVNGAASNVRKVTYIDSQQLAAAVPADVLGAETNNDTEPLVTSAVAPSTQTPLGGARVDYRFPIMIGSIFVVGLSAVALRRLIRGGQATGIVGMNE